MPATSEIAKAKAKAPRTKKTLSLESLEESAPTPVIDTPIEAKKRVRKSATEPRAPVVEVPVEVAVEEPKPKKARKSVTIAEEPVEIAAEEVEEVVEKQPVKKAVAKKRAKAVAANPVPNALFTRIVNTAVVNVEPRFLGRYVNAHIERKLKEIEGVCSDFGWVRPGSVVIRNLADACGEIAVESLSGYVKYNVEYECSIFQPAKEDIFECTVRAHNHYGISADFEYQLEDQRPTVMTVVVQRLMETVSNEIDTVEFKVRDKVNIKLLWVTINRGKQIIVAGGYITKSRADFTSNSGDGVAVVDLSTPQPPTEDDFQLSAKDMYDPFEDLSSDDENDDDDDIDGDGEVSNSDEEEAADDEEVEEDEEDLDEEDLLDGDIEDMDAIADDILDNEE